MMKKLVLKIDKLSKSFGAIKANDNLNLNLFKNEIHALIGQNGSGKSTLVKQISGFLKQDSGQIYLEEIDISNYSAEHRSRMGIARSFQISSVINSFKVIDNFISKTYQDELLKGVGAPSTAWLYQPNMDYGPEDARENPGITNTVAFEQATEYKYSQFVLEILGMGQIQNPALFYALLGLTCKVTDELIPSHRGYRIRGIHQTPIPNPPLHYLSLIHI
mgnify:CR=1 FL=1